MTAGLRKLTLTTHVVFSIGRIGAVAAFLAIAIVGLSSADSRAIGVADLAMYVIGWYVILPAAFGSLLTGLLQSLGTQWGLFRHYWIVAKLLLTVFATAVLLFKMQLMTLLAGVSAGTLLTQLSAVDLRQLRVELLGHAIGGMIVLLSTTVLSVYKPWGRTRFGKRKLREQGMESSSDLSMPDAPPVGKIARRPFPGIPLWAYLVGIHAAGIAVIVVVLHLTGFVGSH